jgi:hypothetical protein
MNAKKMIRKIPVTIMLPVDVVDFLYKMIEQEERELTIKRNLSTVIYRSLKDAHPEMPQYDINQIYSRRRRELEISNFQQPLDPLNLHKKTYEQLKTDEEKMAHLRQLQQEDIEKAKREKIKYEKSNN